VLLVLPRAGPMTAALKMRTLVPTDFWLEHDSGVLDTSCTYYWLLSLPNEASPLHGLSRDVSSATEPTGDLLL
jgi:hypothetical protein